MVPSAFWFINAGSKGNIKKLGNITKSIGFVKSKYFPTKQPFNKYYIFFSTYLVTCISYRPIYVIRILSV